MELHPQPRPARPPSRAWDPAPHDPAADPQAQRQGRALPADARPRVGLRAALPRLRRPRRSTAHLAAALQLPPQPQLDLRPAAYQPRSAPAEAQQLGPRAQAEAAQHEQRALAERPARRQDADLDGRVVGVEEPADAPQAPAVGVELAEEHDLDDEEAAGRRQVVDLAAVRAEDLARRGEVAAVGQPRAGPLEARVGEHGPQLRRVGGEPVGALERLVGHRVLVVDVGRADRVERAALARRPGLLEAVDEVVDGGGRAHSTGGVRSARPASGVDASACSRRGMRPAPRARRPASTAARIACAIATGSWARAIALAHSTPSQPSSIASAASLAVPTPASRMTGTPARSTISEMLYGLRIPMPEPIGEPSGMTAAQPTSSRRRARIGSSFV